MARPLRVDVPGGWYHVSARGIERRAIYLSDSHYEHFLELLARMSERYCVEVHAYCLMGNHYHILIRTPEANTSKAVQWLNVSYSAWFNARLQRVGHVFQGRFKSVLIDNEGSWLLKASHYVHLNPVRTKEMSLGKAHNSAERQGMKKPDAEAISERLEKLRKFRWSSYRAYAGYTLKPVWLHTEVILGRCGSKASYRQGVNSYITRGADSEDLDLMGSVAIGTATFVARAKKLVGKVTREQPDRKFARRLISFEKIVEVVEDEKKEKWEMFCGRRGDCGRDLVLFLARERSGLTFPEIAMKAGGINYKVAEKAVERFRKKISQKRDVALLVDQCEARLSDVGT